MGVVTHIVQYGQLCFAVANTEAHKGLLLKGLQVTDFREVSLGSQLLAQYSVTTVWNSSGGGQTAAGMSPGGENRSWEGVWLLLEH